MNRGIIYVMTTVVPGLIKIGKTGTNNFDARMYQLERNGYSNVTGLQRKFAIEVEDIDAKEVLLDEFFSKSKVPNTELFALDIDLVIQLLSSFEGNQIYPVEKTKEEVFEEATNEMEVKSDSGFLPDGYYYLERNVKGFDKTSGKALVEDGIFKVLKGSICAPAKAGFVPDVRKNVGLKKIFLLKISSVVHPRQPDGSLLVNPIMAVQNGRMKQDRELMFIEIKKMRTIVFIR